MNSFRCYFDRSASPHRVVFLVLVALLSLGRNDDAAAACRKAIELDPRSSRAHVTLAAALVAAGKGAEVLPAARKAVELVASSAEAHAILGSAIHAAVAAGAYQDVTLAAKSMGKVDRAAYLPNEERARVYDRLFEEYLALHDHFGRDSTSMRRLRALRRDAVARREARHSAGADA